ncbi:NAD(P)-dependent oxidoreductase [Streptacidiphilus jiangxiensis]|uniref:Putative NADH-flavin reductase n=1 Tax=Streptacidiphilus jiangxiensis TaxID=235985 RepID=A0A1H7JW61_STRJI|nr:NAD(P)H-binding protein [Streptacidiphilus jiangxiensis]SEK78813.1 Putative NADH-flavin reductase [Streptacidiphilus jiangxiensis]
MRLVVLGATGPTGRVLTDQALAAGHTVTAVARRADALAARPGLTALAVDATRPGALDAAVEGADAVLSALGAKPGRAPVSLYSSGIAGTVDAMARHGVKRLLAISSSALDPAWRPSGEFFFNHVLDPYVNRVVARTAHEDMRRMEALLIAADTLEWTLVRPSGLFDHPVVTAYRTAPDSADGVFTSRADLAAAMLRELDEGAFVRAAMGVATVDTRPGLAKLLREEVLRKR